MANEIDDGVRKVRNQWWINFVILLHFGSSIGMQSLVHIVQYVLRDYSSAHNLYACPHLTLDAERKETERLKFLSEISYSMCQW